MSGTDKKQIPVIDYSKCIYCDMCFDICPLNAILKVANPSCDKCIKYCFSMEVPCNREHYVFCYEQCDSCGLCISACNKEAINWEAPEPEGIYLSLIV
jgi:formate hydrogenlyase subunit 6/NADH:ubiquinone oxidoreductase subunit I